VIDFCLGSRTLSSTPIRFWTVHVDNSEVQFIPRIQDTETAVGVLERPLSLHPCPSAVIIVASAGQEADQIAALELLSATKSADNLAASIFLKPFCFEGQRRQLEV
uniref:Uncharacterized protein n=1 Tax=Aegilops tauschii subsp. strangulata TaxID=200361 RepID=A0A453LL73_AEGTS